MRIELTRTTLAVHGDLWGPKLPLDRLALDSARLVDPVDDPELRITGRIFGGGFAGYRSGWYRLADGSKAQVFLRDGERAIHVPALQGYGLLISAPDAEAVLRLMHRYHDDASG
jgi:hypothetical protein